MKAILRAAISAATLMLCVGETHAQVIFLSPARVFVTNRPENASQPFELRADVLSSTKTATLTAPDGTVFIKGERNNWPSIANLSSTELVNRFAGTWRLDDLTGQTPGQSPKQHRFTVAAADLTFRPPTPPPITSPANGATLPPTFAVSLVDSVGITYIDTPGIQTAATPFLNFHRPSPPGTSKVTVKFDLGQSERNVIVRSWNQNSTPSVAMTPLDPQVSETFRVSIVRDSFSLPTEWTVTVPEPSSLTIGATAMLGLTALRRRKSSRRLPAGGRYTAGMFRWPRYTQSELLLLLGSALAAPLAWGYLVSSGYREEPGLAEMLAVLTIFLSPFLVAGALLKRTSIGLAVGLTVVAGFSIWSS